MPLAPHFVFPAKRSWSRDRKKLSFQRVTIPDKASPFRDDGSNDPLARPAKRVAIG